MKILIGNNTFDILAGSESWMLTLATELKRLGHEVTAYSPQLGFIATKLSAIGVKCVDKLDPAGGKSNKFCPSFNEDDDSFDVVICAHYEITNYIHAQLPDVPIIGVCHGIIHSNPETNEIYPEHPITDFKVNYISVSEEVQGLLKEVYGLESVVIRNFYDLDRFKKVGKLPKQPKVFLVNSNYWGPKDPINKIIKEVSTHYNAEFRGVGANFAPTFEVEECLKDVDVVFGMGRSVFEGACMGKLSVIHGRWGTGGVLTPKSYENLKLTNFSGRAVKGENTLMSAEDIIKDIDIHFNQKNVDAVYDIIKKDHNVKVSARQILDMANKLIG